MRILFVSNGHARSARWGTEFYTGAIAREFVRRGHDVAAFVPERSGARPRYTLEEETGDDGIRTFVVHNDGDPRKRFRDSYHDERIDALFADVLGRFRPDVVHFTYLLWGMSLGVVAACRAAGVRTVATLTDYGLLCHRGQMFDWRLERCGGPEAARCARCVRSLSRHDAGVLRRTLHAAAGRGAAVLGGLGRVPTTRDLAEREAAVRRALDAIDVLVAPTETIAREFRRAGLGDARIERLVYSFDERPYAAARAEPAGPVHFGYLGQFTPHKGVHVLLDAVDVLAGRLPESVEPWTVSLFGGPAGHRHRRYAPRLAQRAHRGRVAFHPPFRSVDAPAILARLHAVVVPSLWDENAPLVCLQSRAAGVPVIGSRVPGIAEVVRDGEHGRLVEPGDALALADAMRDVILGKVGRHPAPALPMPFTEHIERLAGVYAGSSRAAHG